MEVLTLSDGHQTNFLPIHPHYQHFDFPNNIKGLIPLAPLSLDVHPKEDDFSLAADFFRKGKALLEIIHTEPQINVVNNLAPPHWKNDTVPDGIQSLLLYKLFLEKILSTVQDSRLMMILQLYQGIEDAIFFFADNMGGVINQDHISSMLPFTRAILSHLHNTALSFYLGRIDLTFNYWKAGRDVLPKVGIILISTKLKVLIIRERRSKLWGLVKGSLKFGESLLDGACREVSEETPYDNIIMNVNPDLHLHAQLRKGKALHIFAAFQVPERDVPSNCEVMDYM